MDALNKAVRSVAKWHKPSQPSALIAVRAAQAAVGRVALERARPNAETAGMQRKALTDISAQRAKKAQGA